MLTNGTGCFYFHPHEEGEGNFTARWLVGRMYLYPFANPLSHVAWLLVNIFSVHVNHDSDVTMKRTFIIASIDENLGHLGIIIYTEKDYASSYSSTQHPLLQYGANCKLGGTTNIIIQFNHVNEAPTT